MQKINKPHYVATLLVVGGGGFTAWDQTPTAYFDVVYFYCRILMYVIDMNIMSYVLLITKITPIFISLEKMFPLIFSLQFLVY